MVREALFVNREAYFVKREAYFVKRVASVQLYCLPLIAYRILFSLPPGIGLDA